jgi:endonuclease/exonuclease/phosphatase family metal-dependent hydrolase
MRIVSWNMAGGFGHGTTRHADAWDWVRKYPADVFLLQEAVPPAGLADDGFRTIVFEAKVNASRTRWGSGVFSRLAGWTATTTTRRWLDRIPGSCVVAQPLTTGLPWLASIHSSATAIPAHRLTGTDHTAVLRCDDKAMWEIDLIADDLQEAFTSEPVIAGGDLNSSVRLDNSRTDANARLFANLDRLGIHVLRDEDGIEPQTFYRPGTQPLQLDYFLTDQRTAARIEGWTVLTDVVEALGLSDHAPIQLDVSDLPR